MNWEKKPWKYISCDESLHEVRMYLIHSIKILTGVMDERIITESLDEANPLILFCPETKQAVMPPGARAGYFQELLHVANEVEKTGKE